MVFYFPSETPKSQHCPLYSSKKLWDTSRHLIREKLSLSPKKLLWTLLAQKGDPLRSLAGNKGGVWAISHWCFGNKLHPLKIVERQVMLDLAGTDWACLSYTTIKYHFPQFRICSFLLSIKGFKKSFPSCEAVLAFQSKGLLGIDGEYFPTMSEQCAFHTNGWCKESSSLCFLLWFMSLDFHGVAKGSVAEGLVAEGLVAEGRIASSYLWVQRTVYSAPHCFLPASCCALLIFAKMRILEVLPSSEAATFWPRGVWSMRQISDHCAVFPLTFHCQATSGYHNSQHISCQK